MNSRSNNYLHFGLPIALVCAAALPMHAQDDQGKLHQDGLNALKAGDNEGALTIFQQIVDSFGKTAPKLQGPSFGAFYYYKGLAELNLRKYDEAAVSLQTCFEQYPNNMPDAPKSENTVHNMSALKWGDAEKAKGNFSKAVELYEKFIKDKAETDKVNQGIFYANLAVCYLNLEKDQEANIKKGLENLEGVMTNRVNWGVPAKEVLTGLRAIVESGIKTNNEQMIVDFVTKHRSKLKFSDREAVSFGPYFANMAGSAVNAKMNRAALILLGIAPSTKAAIAELESRIAGMGPAKEVQDTARGRKISKDAMEKQLAFLEKSLTSGENFDVSLAEVAAVIQARLGNRNATFTAYEDINARFPKTKNREGNLFNLIASSASIGRMDAAQQYGNAYEKEFPTGPNIEKVRGLTLNSLLARREYAKAIEIGDELVQKTESPSPGHENALSVVCKAFYYAGDPENALERMETYAKAYPQGKSKSELDYFRGSSLRYLGRNDEAADRFRTFLKENPDPKTNSFFNKASTELASVFYATNKFDDALTTIADLEKAAPDAPELASTGNIKGNILQVKKDFVGAKAAYEKAQEIAEKTNNSVLAGEALGSQIAMYDAKRIEVSEEEAQKQILALYDHFYTKHATGSPYAAKIATTAMKSMLAAGRQEDALKRLQTIIVDISKQKRQLGIDSAIQVYSDTYLTKGTPDELKTHFYDFPGIGPDDRGTRALLRIAIVGVYEKIATKAKQEKNQDALVKAEAATKVLFNELETDFKAEDLSNLILVKLGDYLRVNTNSPDQAKSYYESALAREDKTKRYEAHFGLGDIQLKAGQEAEGVKNLLTALKESSEKDQAELKEAALYRVVEFYNEGKKWEKVEEFANMYRAHDKPKFSKHSGEVLLALATSYDQRGDKQNAIANYVTIFGPYASRVPLAVPAYKRWIELIWERNKPGKTGEKLDPNHPQNFSDRQGAIYAAEVWLEALGKSKDKFTPADLKSWEELDAIVKKYIAQDPTVRTLVKIREDRKNL